MEIPVTRIHHGPRCKKAVNDCLASTRRQRERRSFERLPQDAETRLTRRVRLTERRRSRTYRAVGYTTAPVLKVVQVLTRSGLGKAFEPARRRARAGPRAGIAELVGPGSTG